MSVGETAVGSGKKFVGRGRVEEAARVPSAARFASRFRQARALRLSHLYGSYLRNERHIRIDHMRCSHVVLQSSIP